MIAKATVESFPPQIGAHCRVLVLGTVPSLRSLELRQSYGHAQNLFWPFMGELFDAGPQLPYAERIARLHARGIGISQVMPYPFNDTTPVVREYQRLMQGVKSTNYSYYGIEAYITAKVMVEAIKRSGKDLTREKLVQTLEGMSNFDLGGFRVSFTANERAGSRFVDLTVVGSGGRVLR